MTHTGAPPPAMVPGPSHAGQLSPPGGEPETVGEHLKCEQQCGLSEGGSLVGGVWGSRGPASPGHLFRAPRWEPPGELSPLPHHPQLPHTWAKQKRQASVFGGLSVGASLKGWAGPQGGGEPPAQHIGYV